MPGTTHQTVLQRCISEDWQAQYHCCEGLQTHILVFFKTDILQL